MTLAIAGAFSVLDNFGAWTVPPGCAAWIPAGMRHAIEPLPHARTRTVYVRSGPSSRLRRFGGSCVALRLTPLVRALIDHVCDAQRIADARESAHLLDVLLDQLPRQGELPLFVPSLKSPLAIRVAETLASAPDDTPRIRDLATELRVSSRTLERTFIADAGMPLGEWRQRSRICRAIALLAAGGAVGDAALEVGYSTPSAFVAVFKKYVGTTPGKTATRHGR